MGIVDGHTVTHQAIQVGLQNQVKQLDGVRELLRKNVDQMDTQVVYQANQVGIHEAVKDVFKGQDAQLLAQGVIYDAIKDVLMGHHTHMVAQVATRDAVRDMLHSHDDQLAALNFFRNVAET